METYKARGIHALENPDVSRRKNFVDRFEQAQFH